MKIWQEVNKVQVLISILLWLDKLRHRRTHLNWHVSSLIITTATTWRATTIISSIFLTIGCLSGFMPVTMSDWQIESARMFRPFTMEYVSVITIPYTTLLTAKTHPFFPISMTPSPISLPTAVSLPPPYPHLLHFPCPLLLVFGLPLSPHFPL